MEHACAAFKGESYWFEIIAILIAYGANSDELFVRQFFEQHEVALKGKNSTPVYNIFSPKSLFRITKWQLEEASNQVR